MFFRIIWKFEYFLSLNNYIDVVWGVLILIWGLVEFINNLN